MFNLFRGDKKPRTMLDDAQTASGKLIVRGYRKIASQHGCAPTAKTTDLKLLEIYAKVTTAFREAEDRRGQHIPALVKNFIVLKFLQLFEMSGDGFLEEHLRYEVEKYLREGLRQDYNRELPLFEPNSDDPDVKRLKELHRLTGDYLERELLPKGNDPLPLPYAQIAETVFCVSFEVTRQCIEMTEKAALIKVKDSTQEALHCEIVAYHLNVAIANVMVKRHLHGQRNYEQIETGICDEIYETLSESGARLEQYLPIVAKANRDKCRMYFLKNQNSLDISDAQILSYAQKHDQEKIINIPAEQRSIVYYTIRVARLLEVGAEIDLFIVHYVNDVLAKRVIELQEEVCRCLA
jgi:hypothetical protein